MLIKIDIECVFCSSSQYQRHHVWVKITTTSMENTYLQQSKSSLIDTRRRINAATIVVNVSDSLYIFAGVVQSLEWCGRSIAAEKPKGVTVCRACKLRVLFSMSA